MTNKIIKLKNLKCKSCKDLIESEVAALKGIKSIKVDLVKEEAHIEFNSQKINLEEIKSKINSLGYLTKKEKKGIAQGIMYGLIPHIGCIAFIIGSILGVTLLMKFFKPLLMNRYFFHWLLILALIFATLSSILYLRKNGLLSWQGIKKKKKYLATMYGSTIGINLTLFLFIFPLLANVSITGAVVLENPGSLNELTLKSDIPCPGHAPLITNELKTINGVMDVKFSFPNNFNVKYNEKTNEREILSLDVFKEYPAQIINRELKNTEKIPKQNSVGCGCGGGPGGGCCGSCGG